MDLFVVNRHQENTAPINEKKNLDKLLDRIEKNAEKRANRKRKKRELLARVKQERYEKRKFKQASQAEKPKVSENDAYINESLHDPNFDEENNDISSPNKKAKIDSSVVEGFTILGGEDFSKKSKVKRVLPKWLANPTIISANLQNLKRKVSSVKELDRKLSKKLKENNIKYFFPVQAEVIPWLIQANRHANIVFPRDICVSAPTGSGKTLAFVLPTIQALLQHRVKKIRALVILPTQDLAIQVFKTFKKYSQDTWLDVCLITGKNSFENEQKQLLYKNEAFGYVSKVDILVCTAGRLVDHLKSTVGFDLKSLEFLIIDEADRVLDSVQHDWLYHLEKHISNEDSVLQTGRVLNLLTLKKHRPPQKLLFSATLSQDPEKLQKLSLFQPKLFTSVIETEKPVADDTENVNSFIGRYTTPKELTEKYIVCSVNLKPLVLYEFIKQEKLTKTLVFTHSVESTHRLSILLKSLFKENLKIDEISSNLEIKNRNNLIEKFSSGNIDILVCTDSLARGIDLPGVQCVISYSAPKHLKTYIHRAGRTARAGEQGLAVTLIHKSQLNKFQALLEQAVKNDMEEIKIPEENLESLGEQYKHALDALKNTVTKEEKKDMIKMKYVKRVNLKQTKK